MAVHAIHRVYHAVVYGNLKEDAGTVEKPIGRDPRDRKKDGRHRPAQPLCLHPLAGAGAVRPSLPTLPAGWRPAAPTRSACTWRPLAIRWPGTRVYGPRSVIKSLNGQCLHAKELGFVHPVTGEYIQFDSPLPEYFTAFLARLRKG